MKQKTGKLTGLHWLSVVILGMCYTTFGNMQYLVQYYYVMYQEANGLTDMQMSTILTAIGIAAVIAYAYNGFLTDLIKPRLLMTFTLSLAILGGVILLFNPGYVASIIIFCGYALLPMWARCRNCWWAFLQKNRQIKFSDIWISLQRCSAWRPVS